MDKNVVYCMDYCASGSHSEADLGEVCRGFPNQANGVWSAVGRLIFPGKLALETKLCSRISRYSLGIST